MEHLWAQEPDDELSINDAIYGLIKLRSCEMKIVDSVPFQRLRGVKQLSLVHYVYPGAHHTRFEHCLGVFHLCGKYAKHLFPFDPQKQQVIRLAGLLHDIGHGALSHSWDRTVYSQIYNGVEKGHDEHRHRIVKEMLTDKIRDCGVDPQAIMDVWQGKDQVSKAIVNGPVGADRMDFMRRDAVFCGTLHFGTVAVDRIIMGSSIGLNDSKMCLFYKEKVVEDIIQALLGRSAMYRQVYWHPTVSAACMLVEEAIKLSVIPLKLKERTEDLQEFMHVTDDFVMGQILCSKDKELDAARRLTERLRVRDIPKLAYKCTLNKNHVVRYASLNNVAFRKAFERLMKHRFGCVANLKEIIEIRIDDPKPTTTMNHEEFDKNGIYVKTKSGRCKTMKTFLEDTSYLAQFCQNEEVLMGRVYVDSKDRHKVAIDDDRIVPDMYDELASCITDLVNINVKKVSFKSLYAYYITRCEYRGLFPAKVAEVGNFMRRNYAHSTKTKRKCYWLQYPKLETHTRLEPCQIEKKIAMRFV